jgi:mycothiol synthase
MPDILSSLRPFRYSDINGLARLLGEAGGWATHSEPAPEELRARWTRRGVNPEECIHVLPGPDGRLIAYYHATPFSDSSPRMSFETAVLPAWRERGIGSHFYTLALEEAYRRGVTHLSSSVYVLLGDRNEEGTHFLLSRGFTKQSAYLQMRVDKLAQQPAPQPPPGIELRPFLTVPDAPRRWAELIVTAFNEPATAEMIDTQIREPGSDPEGYFFAVDAERGRVVGTCRARLDPSPRSPNGIMGYLGTVGVLPEYRRRGIAQALILQTLDFLSLKGAESAVLFVEERNTNAQALYRSMGWYPLFRSDNYWKKLDSASDPAT